MAWNSPWESDLKARSLQIHSHYWLVGEIWKSLIEKDKKPYKDYKQNMTLLDREDSSDEDIDQNEAIKITEAKMMLDKPYVCQALKHGPS